MRELTDAEKEQVERGIRAEALLSQPEFADAVNEMSNELTNELLSTAAHEKALRETLYYQHRGLSDLIQKLKDRVAARRAVEEQIKALEATELDNFTP